MFQCEKTRYTGIGNLLITYLLTYLLTHLLTYLLQGARSFFEKLTGFHLAK